MADIFFKEDVEQLLYNKFVVVIGDSIQRAVYKDLVLILQKSRYLTENNLRNKGEMSFENDELIEGGKLMKLTNGLNYREVRQYLSDHYLLRFYFVCRCYNAYVESILADLSDEPRPDVVILNSCLWDISRYGPTAIDEYKDNLVTLFMRFKEILPPDCLVIWNTTLPISKNARGGFIIPEIEFMNSTLRLDILEANYYATQVIVENGFDVLDLHFYLRYHLNRRADDGIHWDMAAHRRITNLLLTHISHAWGFPLPGNKDRNQKCNSLEFRFGFDMRDADVLPAPANKMQNLNMFPNCRGLNFNVEQNMHLIGRSLRNRCPGNGNMNTRLDMAYGLELPESMLPPCNGGPRNVSPQDTFQWQPYMDSHGPAPSRKVEVSAVPRYLPYQDDRKRNATLRKVTLMRH